MKFRTKPILLAGVLVLYALLSFPMFIYFLGIAWSSGPGFSGITFLLSRVTLVGLAGFVISLITTLFWRHLFYLWGVLYAGTTICFAAMCSLNIFTDEGPVAFYLWGGIAVFLYITSLAGGLIGRWILRLKEEQAAQQPPSPRAKPGAAE
jgi:hypothetical protein